MKSGRIITKTLSLLMVLSLVSVSLFSPIKAEEPQETAETKPLTGRTISFLGDSITTYVGYSDAKPITDEDCTHRYGEPYYGPEGTDVDCHNTDFAVDDMWWYQSAQNLGAEILMVNSGNSTGVFSASYPADEDWDLYLKEMLAYKSRPQYLGDQGKNPDIIAVYIGSNELGNNSTKDFGSLSEIDIDSLVRANRGSYTYSDPQSVAEAYFIMLHKITNNYPDAEIYCLKTIPNSGGTAATGNTRAPRAYAFNEMLEGVARYFHAIVVDLPEAFGIADDLDEITEDEWNQFKTFFAEGPHPNAEGFDIISEAFEKAVMENSRYVVQVESRAGLIENVETEVQTETDGNEQQITRSAEDYVTDSGMIVDYSSEEQIHADNTRAFRDNYTSQNKIDTYEAEGGSDIETSRSVPQLEVGFILNSEDDEPASDVAYGDEAGVVSIEGDPKESEDDGIYDYTVRSITSQAKAELVTGKIEIHESQGEIDDHDMEYVYSEVKGVGTDETSGTSKNDLIVGVAPYVIPENPVIKDGFDFLYIGSDQYSRFWSALTFTEAQDSLPNEEPVYSDDDYSLYVGARHNLFNRLKVKTLYLPGNTVETEGTPARWDSIQQFALVDRNVTQDGSHGILTAYCADRGTEAVEGFNYIIQNLEDATYYSEEEAQMIRAVANNGYWGDQDFGSLELLKEKLAASGEFTEEELAHLTDGIAMTATQYAIWHFSDIMENIMFVNAYVTNAVESISNKGVEAPDEDGDLIFKLFYYLINLDPQVIADEDKTTANTIINERNFLEAVTVRINGKPQENQFNKDADDTNDVYTVDFSFKLKVRPTEEDDLTMTILDSEGNPLTVGRIAGTIGQGEAEVIEEEDGTYTLANVELQEGTKSLSFVLSGKQYLENDVYLLTSEFREGEDDETSQTLIAVGNGHRSVGIRMDVEFQLNVDDQQDKVEHYWRTEKEVPQLTEIEVVKEWNDNKNANNNRPEYITVHLFAGEKEVASARLTEEKGWKHVFDKLDKYDENEEEIEYSIREDADDLYICEVEGFKLINTPVKTEIEVTKIWDDKDNEANNRPQEITVHLLANGKEVDSAKLNEKNQWKHLFTDLEKYQNRKEITYTVTEDPVDGYDTLVEGFTVTNTPKKTDIEITKIWEDRNNEGDHRPESITVHLWLDEKEIASAEITAENDWKYTFTDLYEYVDGKKAEYYVTEDPVDGYTTVIDGYIVYNRLPVNTGDRSSGIWMWTTLMGVIGMMLVTVLKMKSNLNRIIN